jgi:hypothetical protein
MCRAAVCHVACGPTFSYPFTVVGLVCVQDVTLQGLKTDEETLRLILESIRDGADDSDEDEIRQVGLS